MGNTRKERRKFGYSSLLVFSVRGFFFFFSGDKVKKRLIKGQNRIEKLKLVFFVYTGIKRKKFLDDYKNRLLFYETFFLLFFSQEFLTRFLQCNVNNIITLCNNRSNMFLLIVIEKRNFLYSYHFEYFCIFVYF